MKKAAFYSILFFFFILFNSNELVAQENFIEGYIITLKKDTVKGTIDYREWNLNPISIHFKDNMGKMSILKPDDISGFVVPPKDIYVSSHVSLDLSSLEPKDLIAHKEPKIVKDTALFLLTVVKGRASLFYMKDHNNREHYYVSKDGAPLIELLLKKSYLNTSEGTTLHHNYVATVELFKGQLIVLFNDCPSLNTKINNSDYSIISLRSLVINYNECQHSTIDFVKKEETVKCKFGLLAGPTLTKISFRGGSDDLTDVKMSDCYSFLAGVSFHVIFPRERAKWILVDELVYKPYNNSATSSSISMFGDQYNKSFSFNMGYLKLYTLLRYQYPEWKIKPFIDFGMSNGYAILSSHSKTVVQTSFGTGTKRITTGPAIADAKLYEFGITGGIGASIWKINGEIRYEWAQGMSPQTGFAGPEDTIYLVVSYMF
ncbi:MAG: hypothetical protein ABSD71_02750 [Bacteroidales bacterium]